KACLPCKSASAEFAPDPALDPLWISYWEPFHGAVKKDFGLQVILKVAEDTNPPTPPAANGDAKEKLPEPVPAPAPGAAPAPMPMPPLPVKPDTKPQVKSSYTPIRY